MLPRWYCGSETIPPSNKIELFAAEILMKAQNNTGQMTTSASAWMSVLSFAFAQGLSVSRIEAATGMSVSQLIVPDRRLPLWLREPLWTELSDLAGDRVMSLELGKSGDMAILGGLEDAVRYAPSLRAALQFLVKFGGTIADDLAVAIDETSNACALHLVQNSTSVGSVLVNEVGVGLIIRMLSDALGVRLPVTDIVFAYDANGPMAAYEQAFGLRPTFVGAQNSMILFEKEALHRAPIAANRQRFREMGLFFELRQHLANQTPREDPLLCLSSAIELCAEKGEFSATRVAHEANMSLRSAQRLAALYGKTLKGMIEDARAAKAQSLITENPHASIEDIAARLGYSDERAFRRAFRRWMAMTPTEFKHVLNRQ